MEDPPFAIVIHCNWTELGNPYNFVKEPLLLHLDRCVAISAVMKDFAYSPTLWPHPIPFRSMGSERLKLMLPNHNNSVKPMLFNLPGNIWDLFYSLFLFTIQIPAGQSACSGEQNRANFSPPKVDEL